MKCEPFIVNGVSYYKFISLSISYLRERIIEYCLPSSNDNLLITKSVKDFILSVGDRSPAPGGGSVSALLAALGCGLSAMVSKLR